MRARLRNAYVFAREIFHSSDITRSLLFTEGRWHQQRQCLWHDAQSSRQTAFEEEAYAQELIAATADMSEGIAAFAERRDPAFKGW